VLSLALILLLILAHIKTFEGINSYGFGAAQNRRLPLINYPGLKLSAVPIAEVAIARSDYRYNSRVPYEAMIWTVVFAGAVVTLTTIRRDVAPRLGRILGWGTLCMVGGSAGVLLALTQFNTPRPVTLTLEAALLIPMVEIPLTFLLHRWLAALALAHNRPSAAARLRLTSYVVVVLQLGAVATLAFATLEHPRPFDLKDYTLALPLLTASAVYGATALALAVVSTAAVGSILAGLLAAAIPRRRRVAGRETHQAASPRLAVA
jgi:hypothetical protein